jgi:hypothetical protein
MSTTADGKMSQRCFKRQLFPFVSPHFHTQKNFAKARLNSLDNPENKLCHFSTTNERGDALMLMTPRLIKIKNLCRSGFSLRTPPGGVKSKKLPDDFLPSAGWKQEKIARLFNHKLMRLCVDYEVQIFTENRFTAESFPSKIHVHTSPRSVIKYSSNFFICLTSQGTFPFYPQKPCLNAYSILMN